jgi:hypothetical protein
MPLHRSLTLWLGLLGLLSLLGTWIDSTRYGTEASFRRLAVTHADSALELFLGHGPTRRSITSFHRQAFTSGTPQWFPAYHWEYASGHFTRFLLPHWLLVLAYTTLWIALLAWRQRRIKRARRTLTAPA